MIASRGSNSPLTVRLRSGAVEGALHNFSEAEAAQSTGRYTEFGAHPSWLGRGIPAAGVPD